jgi:hypothetical protein
MYLSCVMSITRVRIPCILPSVEAPACFEEWLSVCSILTCSLTISSIEAQTDTYHKFQCSPTLHDTLRKYLLPCRNSQPPRPLRKAHPKNLSRCLKVTPEWMYMATKIRQRKLPEYISQSQNQTDKPTRSHYRRRRITVKKDVSQVTHLEFASCFHRKKGKLLGWGVYNKNEKPATRNQIKE